MILNQIFSSYFFFQDPVEHDDVVVDVVVGKPGVGGYGGTQVEHTIYNSYILFSIN